MALLISLSDVGMIILIAMIMGCKVLLNTEGARSGPRIIRLRGLSFYHSYKFVSGRHGFMQTGFKTGRIFQFWFAGKQRVIGLAGDSARNFFFLQKHLKFDEAYAELSFNAPKTPSANLKGSKANNSTNAEDESETKQNFARRLQLLMSNSRVSDVLPALLEDIRSQTTHLGREGTFNPFNEIYGTVFRMTTRLSACRQLAENEHDLKQLSKLYDDLHETCAPLGIITPLLPFWGGQRRIRISQEMSQLVRKYVIERSTSETLGEDTIDILLRDGMDLDGIVNFVMRLIFAGTVNTGTNACWLPLFLAKDATWKSRVTSEILQVISKHTILPETAPLHKRLASVPVDAWEDDMPLLDQVIRETLRLTMAHMTGLRKNEHGDIPFGDVVIPKNSFLAYSFADAHLDSKIYTEPLKFDPDRFSPSRSEEKRAPHAYLSWGSGRHPCPGARVAKLELKIIVAYMLAGYEFELVDRNGVKIIDDLELDYNTLTVVHPTRPAFLRYKENPAVVL